MSNQQHVPNREAVVEAFDLAARLAKRGSPSAKSYYEAAYSKLGAYLLERAKAEVARRRKRGTCLDDDDAGEAVARTLLVVAARHAAGLVVEPEHIVNLAENVLLWGRGKIPSMLDRIEREKARRLATTVSLNGGNNGGNGAGAGGGGGAQIPNGGASPGTLLEAKDAIQKWHDALQTEANSKKIVKQLAKRQMLVDLTAFLRHSLTEDLKAAECTHFYEQCKLYERSRRGFELNREASEFFLRLLPTGGSPAQRQNCVNRRLERVVPLLDRMRDEMRDESCDEVRDGIDLFGISEKAAALRGPRTARRAKKEIKQ